MGQGAATRSTVRARRQSCASHTTSNEPGEPSSPVMVETRHRAHVGQIRLQAAPALAESGSGQPQASTILGQTNWRQRWWAKWASFPTELLARVDARHRLGDHAQPGEGAGELVLERLRDGMVGEGQRAARTAGQLREARGRFCPSACQPAGPGHGHAMLRAHQQSRKESARLRRLADCATGYFWGAGPRSRLFPRLGWAPADAARTAAPRACSRRARSRPAAARAAWPRAGAPTTACPARRGRAP